MALSLRPIVELSVAEARSLLVSLDAHDVPPLEALENEDWGRDWVLTRVHDLHADQLEALGLTRSDPEHPR